MNRRASRPAKPEKANRNAEGAEESRWEPLLGLDLAILIELGLGIFVQEPEERRTARQIPVSGLTSIGGMARQRT